MRRGTSTTTMLLILTLVLALPVVGAGQEVFSDGFESRDLSQWSSTTLPPWLEYLDRFRAQSGVQWPGESTSWSDGCVLHSRYCVKNDVITHDEDPSNLWYTAAGAAAGQSGNVAVSSSVAATDDGFLDLWMAGPFHAVGILDPQLAVTGYGSYRENIGTKYHAAATLDVLRGLGGLPAGTSFPLYFPGDGGRTWVLSYGGGESPDPLTACTGYVTPTGPPLILQLGSGSLTPTVTAHAVLDGTTPVDHCVFTEDTYENPNPTYQSLGRNVLGARDAVVVMPRNPLVPGHTYTVSLTVNGAAYSWSFTARSTATALRQPLEEEESAPREEMGTPPAGGRELAPRRPMP